MDINKKSPDLLLMEECFKNIKAKQDITGNLDTIRRVLKRMFDLNFNISIVNNDTNQFFGMNIYPTVSTIDQIVDAIINNKSNGDVIVDLWQKNNQWFLEMDSILLFDSNLNANPSELVAVLLHEIGHIVYSNSVPQRINKVMRFEIMKLNFTVKHLLKYDKVRKIFDLVIVEACSTKNFNYTNVDTERVADQFVVKMGYADELDNFINKLIQSQGNSLVNRPDHDIDNDVKTIINWSVDNIAELQYRKTKLKSSIQTELIQNPSHYVKDIFTSIKTAFFGNDTDSYKSLVSEQYLIQGYNKIVRESILDIFDGIGKVKKIAQSDLDILSINIDKIQNNDDKIYVLDTIYDKLDLVNLALDYLNQGKNDKVAQSKQTLETYKKQLETMRQQVLNVQIQDKKYGVFIKYPKGYEG